MLTRSLTRSLSWLLVLCVGWGSTLEFVANVGTFKPMASLLSEDEAITGYVVAAAAATTYGTNTDLRFNGVLKWSKFTDGLSLGLEVHEGSSCEDVGAVIGSSSVDQVVSQDTVEIQTNLTGLYSPLTFPSVLGKTLVIRSTSALMCAEIEDRPTAYGSAVPVVELDEYPGYTGPLDVEGSLYAAVKGDRVTLFGELEGLERNVTAGIHIHEGSSCEENSKVGGHLVIAGSDSDPWTTTYVSDMDGKATVLVSLPGFLFTDVYQRTVVVHSTSGKIACGVIRKEGLDSVVSLKPNQFVTYADVYDGEVAGNLAIYFKQPKKVNIIGTLKGVPPNVRAGIHVHEGTSCESPGGHLLLPKEPKTDPWETYYVSTASGSASVQVEVEGFASGDILGKPLVIHSPSAKIACVMINEDMLTRFDDESDSESEGDIYVVKTTSAATQASRPKGLAVTAVLLAVVFFVLV